MHTRTVVHLVPHTHWDREWYLPFQSFRTRLVGLIDGLLEEMERDPRVRFTLDGQTATVDDYLEIRPEAAERLARLVRAGRLAVGPWAILMDEFLVSGETIVRNLELGLERATQLGKVMAVGYLPDMFGHIAQMPQILARAGIGDAVVWRGVPAAIDGHVFTWRAPDGSAVRCEYLYLGYGQARDVFDLADRIERKLEVYQSVMGPWFGDDDLLAMYGEDHSLPLPGYATAIADFNARQNRFDVRVETLGEYIEHTRGQAQPTKEWTGELRSGARANVLMGVASHRIEVKQAAARAERWLERRAEPLLALHGRAWPEQALRLAWRRVIENSAHDSICACSCEETVQQVLARYAEAEQIGRALVDDALRRIGDQAPAGSWVVWNPSPVDRVGLVEISIPAEGPAGVTTGGVTPSAAQDLGIDRAILDDRELPASDVVPYLKQRMHSRELYTYLVNGFALEPGEEHDDVDVVTLHVARVPDPTILDIDELLDELDRAAAAAEAANGPRRWRLRVVPRPQRRLLVEARVPALGLATLVVGGADATRSAAHPVVAGDRRLANGLVSVVVDADGTLTMERDDVILAGVARIVDGGDAGDSYNYAPPTTDTIIEAPTECRVSTRERGPLRGILEVRRLFRWPAGLSEDSASREERAVPTEVTTTVELRAGEPFVRLHLEFDNQSRDHRIRLHVPLPLPVDRSYAEGQFAIVERGLEMEGGHGEYPLPTFPAHGLVGVDGVVVLLDHLTEYEIVEGRELAITLLRATGLISRDQHAWRAEPAGPVIEAPSGQGIGPRSMTFAILPQRGAPGSDALEALERYRSDFLARPASGPPTAPVDGRGGLAIEGPAIAATALRRRGDALEVRIVNESDENRVARIRGQFASAVEVDLMGRSIGMITPARGRHDLELRPWEIRTVRLLQ
jgi:mannosylglycerate hydrolase